MIHPSIEAKNTGVTLKSHLTKSTHVRQTCRVTFFHLSRINKIRRYMDNQSVKWVVNAVVLSRLDYCNSLLVGLAGDLLKRLHHVQNSAARTILDLKRLEPVRRHLNSLCWLPITELKVSLHPVTWPAIGRQEFHCQGRRWKFVSHLSRTSCYLVPLTAPVPWHIPKQIYCNIRRSFRGS